MDLAYSKVFQKPLSAANSLTLTKAQGRAASGDPRHSIKSNFALGPRQLLHVSVWAHVYSFEPLNVFEFVSLRADWYSNEEEFLWLEWVVALTFWVTPAMRDTHDVQF